MRLLVSDVVFSITANSSLTDTYIAYPYQKSILTIKKNIMATHKLELILNPDGISWLNYFGHTDIMAEIMEGELYIAEPGSTKPGGKRKISFGEFCDMISTAEVCAEFEKHNKI